MWIISHCGNESPYPLNLKNIIKKISKNSIKSKLRCKIKKGCCATLYTRLHSCSKKKCITVKC